MNVTIMDGCTACGACEAINSEVFYVDTIAHVNQDAVERYEQDCIDAALICPVNAIWIDEL
ncbi:ferredoxin I [Candidatus Gastranaerophilus sp. (ex Termes propinquus)]|nr:ferredoxin I [Candidatus Gastranaerophilus sp. (ex Termes propinquus)]